MARVLRAVVKEDGKLGLAEPAPIKTPVRKQIGWHIAQKQPHAGTFLIGPDDAKELLERNAGADWRNRSASQALVDRYAREMREGRWRLSGEGLIISKTGKLRNGQHRLLACVQAGVPFETFIVFGVEDEVFQILDRGRPRTSGNIFDIAGEPYYNRLASATLWTWKYLTKHMTHGGSYHPTPEELLSYYREEHPGLLDSAVIGGAFDGSKERLTSGSLMMALHYLCAKKDPVLADAFFKGIARGENLRARAPAYKVRAKLLEIRLSGGRPVPYVVAAMTINAWNAVRAGRSMKKDELSYDPAQPFPEIV